MDDKDRKSILVLGFGVSGLSTSIMLLEQGYKVTVWAKDLPPNITSNKAMAVLHPSLYFTNNNSDVKDNVIREEFLSIGKFTYDYFKNNFLDNIETGCMRRVVREIFDKEKRDPWWVDSADNFRRIMNNELESGYIDGYKIDSIVINPNIYLSYLTKIFKNLGGIIIQKEVQNIEEVLNTNFNIIINCTGLGSINLFNDHEIHPVRGQSVVIKAIKGINEVTVDHDDPKRDLCILVPRLNDIVLGGTNQLDNWNLNINSEDTEKIIERCREINPLLKDIKILDITVGLRPQRSNVRLEKESVGNKIIIHNYGHGPSGFTLSWGCSMRVLDIINSSY